MKQFLAIAEVLKPQGVRGQVKLRIDMDQPEDLLNLHSFYCAQGEAFIPVQVDAPEIRDGYGYAVLDHAASRDAAEKQRGMILFARRDEMPPLADGKYYIVDIVGCEVFDEQGRLIGRVADVVHPGAVDIYEVESPRGSLRFPALQHVICQTDIDQQRIVVIRERFDEVAVLDY